jgi:hypothetical protein
MERHIVFDFIGIFTILNIHMTGKIKFIGIIRVDKLFFEFPIQ